MNYRLTTILLAVALLLVVGVGATQAAPPASVKQVAPAGHYDFTNHGTAWVPENRAQFSAFIPRGWGTATRAKAAGSYWVHIPVPYPSVMADSIMYITYVEFCAKSNNYTKAYPVHWDLYEANGTNFYSENISWPANNAYNCWGHTFSPGTWRQDLGISVIVTYQDTTSVLTLYKAWVSVNAAP
jgi:hypothetical protein